MWCCNRYICFAPNDIFRDIQRFVRMIEIFTLNRMLTGRVMLLPEGEIIESIRVFLKVECIKKCVLLDCYIGKREYQKAGTYKKIQNKRCRLCTMDMQESVRQNRAFCGKKETF